MFMQQLLSSTYNQIYKKMYKRQQCKSQPNATVRDLFWSTTDVHVAYTMGM